MYVMTISMAEGPTKTTLKGYLQNIVADTVKDLQKQVEYDNAELMADLHNLTFWED